ncbi:hypothetical protein MMC34_005160 [Xylographa carneopallida]|nr:hypothetical protein [Xylographa carneopallida]
MSKLNFKNANEFHPERWLPEGLAPDSPYKDDRRDAVNVFSLGPRSCLGRNLAYLELKLVLARVLYNFNLSLPGGPGSGLIWTSQKTYTTWVKEPFIICMKRSCMAAQRTTEGERFAGSGSPLSLYCIEPTVRGAKALNIRHWISDHDVYVVEIILEL